MTLTELDEQEIRARTAIGKPVVIGVPFHDGGWERREEYSERVRRSIGAMATDGAKAYSVGDQAVPFEAQVKDIWSIINSDQRKGSIEYVSQPWFAQVVQYFE